MGKRRHTDYRYEDGRRPTWEAIRQHVLVTQPECAHCGQPSVEVDHIWPRFYGGDDRQLNLQALCVPCNRAKGNQVDLQGATAYELSAAVQAVLERAVAAVDDLDRFLDPLIAAAVTDVDDVARRDLRVAKAVLGVLVDEATARYDRVDGWLVELAESGGPSIDDVFDILGMFDLKAVGE